LRIPREARRLYRARRDLRRVFLRPFDEANGLFAWLRSEGGIILPDAEEAT
jgi:hypothetical protein